MIEHVNFEVVISHDRIEIDTRHMEYATLRVSDEGTVSSTLHIDYQQMYELGILLASYAIRKAEVDKESVDALLEEFLIAENHTFDLHG